MKNFVLYGFSENDIFKIQNIVRPISSSINYITINDNDFSKTLGEVISEKKFEFQKEFMISEKIVIFQNIHPKEIDVYFRLLKNKISKDIMFASVTENSINMVIKDLFDDFQMEREFFKKNK